MLCRPDMLFEKDGTPGIRRKDAGGMQNDIPGAIMHLYSAPEKVRVACHLVDRVRFVAERVNSTKGLTRAA